MGKIALGSLPIKANVQAMEAYEKAHTHPNSGPNHPIGFYFRDYESWHESQHCHVQPFQGGGSLSGSW